MLEELVIWQRFLDGTFDPCVTVVSKGHEKTLSALWSNSINSTNVWERTYFLGED